MSIYVMAPVLRCQIPDVPATDAGKGSSGQTLKLVLLGLADSANEDGTGARPGIRNLALFAQCHTATVVRALRHLAELGAIHLAAPGAPRRCAVYDVDLGWVTSGVPSRARGPLPCAPEARKNQRAPEARAARAPEARAARAPGARSYVSPSVTSPREPVSDAIWHPCQMPGCDVLVDPWKRSTRCDDHVAAEIPVPPALLAWRQTRHKMTGGDE